MKVSVIIPVFNGAATIARAIDSALSQRFDGGFEVVVVNDGSTDGTSGVLACYGERIKIVDQENRGLAAARNSGVRASTGEYIAFLDDDDVWLPQKLSATVAALEQRPECVLVYSDAILVDDDEVVLQDWFVPPEHRRPPSMEDLLSQWWHVSPCTVVMRRSSFDLCGGFCEEFGTRWGWEDQYMWLVARGVGPFGYLPEPLVRIRRNSSAETFQSRLTGSWMAEDWPAFSRRAVSSGSNFELFLKLVTRRYGAAAARLVDEVRTEQSQLLVTLGLLAMYHGDQLVARRSYADSLRYRPIQPKLIFRLLWTFLPPSLARRLCGFLPWRIARAVAGPPMGVAALQLGSVGRDRASG